VVVVRGCVRAVPGCSGVPGGQALALSPSSLDRLDTKHSRTRARRPRTNGKARRFIQALLRGWAYARTCNLFRRFAAGDCQWRDVPAARIAPVARCPLVIARLDFLRDSPGSSRIGDGSRLFVRRRCGNPVIAFPSKKALANHDLTESRAPCRLDTVRHSALVLCMCSMVRALVEAEHAKRRCSSEQRPKPQSTLKEPS
jgi:hypothetical protein